MVSLSSNKYAYRESSLMKMLETMGVSAATARFCLVLYCSVVIQYLTSEAECRDNYGKPNVYKCPKECICDRRSQTVNCSNAGLQAVPTKIEPDTLSLILDGNKFPHLTRGFFRNLPLLRNLSMRHCQINTVRIAALSRFNKSLRALWMSNNPFAKRTYKFLIYLEGVDYLDMSSTNMKTYHRYYSGFFNLKYFFLANNSIAEFPGDILSPSLVFLDLSRNCIRRIFVDSEKNQNISLTQLILKANAIKKLHDDTFRHFSHLEDIDLSYNQLSDIQPLALRSTSLKIIDLCRANFSFNRNNSRIFQEAQNIERINMSFSRIESWNLTVAPFHNLLKLTDLDLSGTGISSLSHMLADLPNLKRLRLSSNLILTLERADLESIEDSLRELDVSSGKLSTISFESLPLKVWRSLRVVDFSDNPFLCDCNFIWLRRWLKRAKASKVEVRGWNKYYCQTSKGQVNMLQLESPSDIECFQDPLFQDRCLLAVHLLTWSISILASAVSALQRFRWRLRCWTGAF